MCVYNNCDVVCSSTVPLELTLPWMAPSVPVIAVMLRGRGKSSACQNMSLINICVSVLPLASSITALIALEVNQLCGIWGTSLCVCVGSRDVQKQPRLNQTILSMSCQSRGLMKSWWLNTNEGHTTLITIIRIVMKGNPERIILIWLDSFGPLHHCWIKNY